MVENLFIEQRKYINHFFEFIDLDKTKKIINALLKIKGKIIFTGVGKSGIIANKLAMTMLSTGTLAVYISPSDALHGDVGIVENGDIIIMLSKTGETKELLDLIPFIRKKKAQIISLVSKENSKLANYSDIFISLPLKKEICPFNLAPTTSTAIQLIFGDILAVSLMKKKNFSLDEYAINHPSGTIGRKIALKVEDIMVNEKDLPLCSKESKLIDILPILSEKKCGSILIIDDKKVLQGIFTDGDLRRTIEKEKNQFLNKKLEDVMTKTPAYIHKDALAYDAMVIMEKNPNKLITVLPVLDHNKKVLGLIRLHDIIQLGIK